MSRTLLSLTITLMLATIGLLGLAPTAAADDCAAGPCVENCHVGAGPGRITAQCDVQGNPTGIDGCMEGAPCAWTASCSALVYGENPDCTVAPMDTEVCHYTSPQYGVCVDPYGEDCKLWVTTHFGGTRCIITPPST